MGEAVNALLRDDPDLLERRPDIAWRGIVGMRNRLVHEYERVEPAYVWGTVDDDLRPLRLAIERERDRLACSSRVHPPAGSDRSSGRH